MNCTLLLLLGSKMLELRLIDCLTTDVSACKVLAHLGGTGGTGDAETGALQN